jgi:hypothetical protein
MLELLISELDISEREVFHLPGPLDLTGPVLASPTSIEPNSSTQPSFRRPIPPGRGGDRRSPLTCSPL